jgi:hypothetical protein
VQRLHFLTQFRVGIPAAGEDGRFRRCARQQAGAAIGAGAGCGAAALEQVPHFLQRVHHLAVSLLRDGVVVERKGTFVIVPDA